MINDVLLEIYKTSLFAGNALIQWLGVGTLIFLYWKYFIREIVEDISIMYSNYKNQRENKK